MYSIRLAVKGESKPFYSKPFLTRSEAMAFIRAVRNGAMSKILTVTGVKVG